MPDRTDPAALQGDLLRELGAARVRRPEGWDDSQHLMRLANDPLLVHAVLQRAEQRIARRPAEVKLPLMNRVVDRSIADVTPKGRPYGLVEPLHPPSHVAETFASSREDREQAFTIGAEPVRALPIRPSGWMIVLPAVALLVSALLMLAHL